MKKKNKALLLFICIALAVLIPVIFIVSSLAFLPKIYGGTFLGELADKYELLNSTNDKKIVIVGGSSVAFGLNCETIEKATGYKTVNFGLYATLGTKLMLDLSRSNVNDGDIIILAPELNEQTLSLYFNATSAWQALEGNLGMLRYVGSDNYGDLCGNLFEYLGKRWNYAIQHRTVSQTGVYSHESFNRYGDIVYPREYNVMTYEYDKAQKITLTSDIFDPEFIDYVNDYIAFAEKKGATVYFSYCPMNSSALASGTTDESILEFNNFIDDRINCEIISSPMDSILDKGYFYDTNFHLNDAGVAVHTQRLANDILRTLGRTDALTLELPAAPGKKPADTTPIENPVEDPFEKYFLFDTIDGLVTVTGTTDAAAYLTELTVPDTWEGKPVAVLGKEGTPVFSSCLKLKYLTINDKLSLITDGAFASCPTLEGIYMERENEEALEASPDVFTGASDKLKILFHSESAFDKFSSGYWWALHSARMAMAPEK